MEFDGKRIDNGNRETTAELGIAQILEGRHVFGHLTVDENLRAGAYSVTDSSITKGNLSLMYSYFPRLNQLRNELMMKIQYLLLD